MKHLLIDAGGHSRLILIFLGWGMDSKPFRSLRREGYDVMLIWDYRRMSIDWSICRGYEEICVIAWSMGVFAAAHTTQAIENRITLRLAVNGTLHPVNDSLGIPENIYYGTLDTLDDRRLAKFYRRMFADRESYAIFQQNLPDRHIEELKEELRSIASATYFSASPVDRCDIVLISEDDRIFPAPNVWRAWAGRGSCMRAIPGGHYPDMQRILDDYVIDKTASERSFAKATGHYKLHASTQAAVKARLIADLKSSDCAQQFMRQRCNLLEIGAGVDDFSAFFMSDFNPRSHKTYWDLNAPVDTSDDLSAYVRCDAELEVGRPQRKRYAMALSSSTIQWFNSPTKFLDRLADILVTSGVAAIATYVKGNLPEIRYAAGVGLSLPTFREWINMASKRFDVIKASAYIRELPFDSPTDAFRHLSATGVNGLGPSMSPVRLRAAIGKYPRRLDGKYYLTFKPAILILKKKQ